MPVTLWVTSATLLLLSITRHVTGTLQYATYYQDHMVLQRAPHSALVWGYASKLHDIVTVVVQGRQPVHTHVVKGEQPEYTRDFPGRQPTEDKEDSLDTGGMWLVKIPPVTEPGPFTITASSSEGNATLRDVLFGDVWACVGQTDMEFPMAWVSNSTEEIRKASGYQQVRVMKPATVPADQPRDDVEALDLSWSLPHNSSLYNFSAVCWLFGEHLSTHTRHPVGLIQLTYPEFSTTTQDSIPPMVRGYWNGLLYPFSRVVMSGLVWYQGTGNLEVSYDYGYEFTVLMQKMRDLFFLRSLNETSLNLPIGIVQMGPVLEKNWSLSAPMFRWGQSFDYGVVPNSRQTHAFMAVTLDLTDPNSPYGPDHPRCKQDIARRLVSGARNIAYGEHGVVFKGPYPNNISFVHNETKLMQIHYDQEIDVRVSSGFEFCCSSSSSEKCYDTDRHVPAPMVTHDSTSVTLSYAGCGTDWLVGVNYAWKGSPCLANNACAVYGRKSELPAPPYINGWPWYTPPR